MAPIGGSYWGISVSLSVAPIGGRGVVAQSEERTTPCEEVLGSISAVAARSLLVGSVSLQCDLLRETSWSSRSPVSCVAARKIVRRSVLGPVRDIAYLLTRTVGNQPTKQTNNPIRGLELVFQWLLLGD